MGNNSKISSAHKLFGKVLKGSAEFWESFLVNLATSELPMDIHQCLQTCKIQTYFQKNYKEPTHLTIDLYRCWH